ncbi:hypothetical protein [Sphingomonas nostoxanthinifaciens]|uniref:hypothetical protein n=1 Tax=Sphingomonas nostoxanthinifaciens TaxID=2872652 RepID=UPI001CC21D63|nr:hypothetical protein [Sphingomonas nostoxanthinifaciens]UAK24151.1 hypothetical protein K8P63_17765 [Sphingomonas nostoxanthinifaciens]
MRFAPPPIAPPRSKSSRWTAEAYLFARPGSGQASLAAGGLLGGSQAAARLTYRLNPEGPIITALAARLYAPLSTLGAEGAVGLDWHPLPRLPLRLSIERRLALDKQGRRAWSAYAAGGFYREPIPGVFVIDGYAQAGVVGAHHRDLFVDGAIRTGRRLAFGPATATLGAALWGAAQPGVSRIDTGPRIGVTMPLADHVLSVAVEGRLRVAGQASPGSGAALTLGVDL